MERRWWQNPTTIFSVEHVTIFPGPEMATEKKFSAVAILHVAQVDPGFFTLRCGGAVSDMGTLW